MEIKIDGKEYRKFSGLSVKTKHDALSSTFGFDLHFDPENEDHRAILRPGAFPSVELSYKGERFLTGTILNPTFESQTTPKLTPVDGYSITGFLEDCQPPNNVFPLQSNNRTIREIVSRFIDPFGLSLEVDPQVASKVDSPVKVSAPKATDKVAKYLADLVGQKDLLLSHDANGRVLITSARTDSTPILDLSEGVPSNKVGMDFDGSSMHSEITVMKQSDPEGGRSAQSTIKNPFVNAFRPKIVEQTSGDDIDTQEAAKNALAKEISNIKFTFEIDRWENTEGALIAPNNLVRVRSPELHIFDPVDLFIQEVTYDEKVDGRAASLGCVLPEVYTKEEPRNIFS